MFNLPVLYSFGLGIYAYKSDERIVNKTTIADIIPSVQLVVHDPVSQLFFILSEDVLLPGPAERRMHESEEFGSFREYLRMNRSPEFAKRLITLESILNASNVNK